MYFVLIWAVQYINSRSIKHFAHLSSVLFLSKVYRYVSVPLFLIYDTTSTCVVPFPLLVSSLISILSTAACEKVSGEIFVGKYVSPSARFEITLVAIAVSNKCTSS